MNQKKKPEIYFHVGLGKTASTYLQYKLFPKLKGIHYIQRTRYNDYPSIIEKHSDDKFLISREFDRQFIRETGKMAEYDPDARIIVVLRRNDSWIASQYRRYVKNGGFKSFDAFLDLENNRGYWEREEVLFYPKLKFLEDHFNHKPLILFHDELKSNPWKFFQRIAEYTGTTYDKNQVSVRPSHKSYNTKQLLIIRNLSKKLFKKDKVEGKTKLQHYIKFRSRWLLCHLILYGAKIIPSNIEQREEIIPKSSMEKVKSYYAEDWQQCLDFAREKSYDPTALEGLKKQTL